MRQRRWEARSSGQRYRGSATTYTRNEQPDVDLPARSQKARKVDELRWPFIRPKLCRRSNFFNGVCFIGHDVLARG